MFLKDGNTLFVTGGYDLGGNSTGKSWTVDTISGLVQVKSNMIYPRIDHGITRINDTVYCAGGNTTDGGGILDSFEYFCVKDNFWKSGPNLITAKFQLKLVNI